MPETELPVGPGRTVGAVRIVKKAVPKARTGTWNRESVNVEPRCSYSLIFTCQGGAGAGFSATGFGITLAPTFLLSV